MKKILFVLMSFVILFAGCSKDEESNTYSLTGQVKNVTDRLVKSGTVNLMADAAVAYTTTIKTDGTYTFEGVKSGSYTLKVVAPGYDNFEEAVTVSANATKNAVIMGGSTIKGSIINSQTGQGLANAQLAFTFAGTKSGDAMAVDTTLAGADFVITTDASGYYELEGMAVGVFVVVIRSENFTTRVITNVVITVGIFEMPAVTIVENVAVGSIRVVLTWGLNPYDLDSHLTGPGSDGNRFHMYYSNQSPAGSDVNLDVDDQYSYGPETTTIEQFHNGMYRYSVFNYSEQGYDGGAEIFSSPTRVEIYDYTGLVKSYTAPAFTAGTGNTWRVFELNISGSTYSITDINTYLFADDDYMEKSSFVGRKPAVSYRPDVF